MRSETATGAGKPSGGRRTSGEALGVDAGGVAAIENRDGHGRFVIVCDHASNRIPAALGTLGLDAAALRTHIAWDPGALGVARHLARLVDAPLVFATVSRLVVDVNRDLDRPDLVAATSEDVVIPGNRGLSAAGLRRRIETVHEPYHRAIEALVDERLAAGRATALVAVHSYTPVYRGVPRPWQAGILFDRDRSLADRLIAGLGAEGLDVGVNEPYAPADGVYYTLSRHAGARGLASVMIEIRNDLLRSAAEERAWAARLARLLEPAGAAAHA